MKVYLSYHSNDRAAAEGLARGLAATGLHVVDPMRDVAAAENIFEWTAKALEDSQAMVFVVSPDAVDSQWTRKELEYALMQSRFEGRIVPVLARPTKRFPWILKKFGVLDLKSGASRTGRKASELIRRTLSERRRQLGS